MQTETVMDTLIEDAAESILAFKNNNILYARLRRADGCGQSRRPAAYDHNLLVIHEPSLKQLLVKTDQIC